MQGGSSHPLLKERANYNAKKNTAVLGHLDGRTSVQDAEISKIEQLPRGPGPWLVIGLDRTTLEFGSPPSLLGGEQTAKGSSIG
jgi:hypothetical protein